MAGLNTNSSNDFYIPAFASNYAKGGERISLKAEESGQFAAAVGAQKMLYELLLRRKLDHEAAKACRPGWGYRHGNTRS